MWGTSALTGTLRAPNYTNPACGGRAHSLALYVQELAAQACTSRSECPAGRLCADGKCVCPIMYSGDANCTSHVDVADWRGPRGPRRTFKSSLMFDLPRVVAHVRVGADTGCQTGHWSVGAVAHMC